MKKLLGCLFSKKNSAFLNFQYQRRFTSSKSQSLVIDDMRKTLHIPVKIGNPLLNKDISKPLLLQVDTACSFNTISETVARALKLNFLAEDFGTNVVGGKKVLCPIGIVEFTIEIKGEKMTKLVPTSILPGRDSPNLFGVAALQAFSLGVDMVNCELLRVEKKREHWLFWNLEEHLKLLKASNDRWSLDRIFQNLSSSNVNITSLICSLDPDSIGKPPASDVCSIDSIRSLFSGTGKKETLTLVPKGEGTNDVLMEIPNIGFVFGYDEGIKEDPELKLVDCSIEERIVRDFKYAAESIIPILPKLNKSDRNSIQQYAHQLK